MNYLSEIEQALLPLRKKLESHPLYLQLRDLDDIKVFMKHHVFAVWDFMSLLKSLQAHLTCNQVPWVPAKNNATARFINEIVLGEETDLNELSEPKSHFEMYLDAMHQIGADTEPIYFLLELLEEGQDINTIIPQLGIDSNVKQFLQFTFDTIASSQTHLIASAFTFGREDLIPDMFINILDKIDKNNTHYSKLRYYLDRHIELDGDEHGPLSLKMIEELCGNDRNKWMSVKKTAIKALESRLELWSCIHQQITKSQKTAELLVDQPN